MDFAEAGVATRWTMQKRGGRGDDGLDDGLCGSWSDYDVDIIVSGTMKRLRYGLCRNDLEDATR